MSLLYKSYAAIKQVDHECSTSSTVIGMHILYSLINIVPLCLSQFCFLNL